MASEWLLVTFAKGEWRGAIKDVAASGLRGLLGPYHLARYATAAALLAAAVFVWLTLRMPMSDVAFRPAADAASVTVAGPSGPITLRADSPVVLRGPNGAMLTAPALQLAESQAAADPERARLASWLRAGPVAAEATDAHGERRRFSISVRSARLSDLTASYWQSVLCGAVSMLFGIGVWMIRRRDWGAQCFAWVGVWLFASAAADSLVELWNVATPRSTVMHDRRDPPRPISSVSDSTKAARFLACRR